MRGAGIFLLACFAAAGDAGAAEGNAEPRIRAEVDVEPAVPVTDEERRAIYLAAGRVLKHVDQAREALEAEDRGQAVHHVEQARLLIDIIGNALPVYDVRARIESGELVYEDREEVQDTVITVFDELERAALLAPVKAARIEAREAAGEAPTAVVDVGLVHTRAELDVDAARVRLEAALSALKDREHEAADDLLAAVQTSVRLTRVEIDLPLERARTNLMLARDRLDEGRLEDARLALRVAIDALADYEAAAQASRAEEAAALRGEMAELENTIQSDARQAREKLDAWWDRLSEWSR